jgi:hypothetical protein
MRYAALTHPTQEFGMIKATILRATLIDQNYSRRHAQLGRGESGSLPRLGAPAIVDVLS